ncbi:hypothetical protein [Alkalihalobacterium chitinilyticum]|uniref:Uncharacterized protein n=1 Tax=Alkalihalobacterium chitinilyticum TaxID=2980103 RepID=A0ABT5VDH1_9BACI|nr:hypothetical protein [Alkalihalobacterium chitinilyticum]MDE5413206.1 hypothetical protein [Alkalihalobacterium chitinilyticum]
MFEFIVAVIVGIIPLLYVYLAVKFMINNKKGGQTLYPIENQPFIYKQMGVQLRTVTPKLILLESPLYLIGFTCAVVANVSLYSGNDAFFLLAPAILPLMFSRGSLFAAFELKEEGVLVGSVFHEWSQIEKVEFSSLKVHEKEYGFGKEDHHLKFKFHLKNDKSFNIIIGESEHEKVIEVLKQKDLLVCEKADLGLPQ